MVGCAGSRSVGDYVMCIEVAVGTHMPLFQACYDGTCSCVYILNGVTTQLKPCRCCSMHCTKIGIYVFRKPQYISVIAQITVDLMEFKGTCKIEFVWNLGDIHSS